MESDGSIALLRFGADMKMKRIILGCRTLEDELCAAMRACGCVDEVRWFESGLHNVPARLHGVLQSMLDDCQGCDTVLLAMGVCGNAVSDLRTHGFQMVVPRADDCIGLLLGGAHRPVDSYFLTHGWLRGERNLWREYEHCIEKYGDKRGKRIFSAMFHNYNAVTLLNTGCFDMEAAAAETREIAQRLKLQYLEQAGSLSRLEALLLWRWSAGDFIITPPNSTLRL